MSNPCCNPEIKKLTNDISGCDVSSLFNSTALIGVDTYDSKSEFLLTSSK